MYLIGVATHIVYISLINYHFKLIIWINNSLININYVHLLM